MDTRLPEHGDLLERGGRAPLTWKLKTALRRRIFSSQPADFGGKSRSLEPEGFGIKSQVVEKQSGTLGNCEYFFFYCNVACSLVRFSHRNGCGFGPLPHFSQLHQHPLTHPVHLIKFGAPEPSHHYIFRLFSALTARSGLRFLFAFSRVVLQVLTAES